MEPFILPIAIETIRETASAATAEVSKNALESAIAEASKVSEFYRTQEFNRYLGEQIGSSPYLSQARDSIARMSPTESLAKLNELKGDINFKGKLGEAISVANHRSLGEVSDQVAVRTIEGFDTGSRIDHITLLRDNTQFKELVVENGHICTRDLYFNAGETVATEVKNGSFNYLINELSGGHLPKQIAAGLLEADNSIVEINNDCMREILSDSSQKAVEAVKSINEVGGHLVIGLLPDYNTQLNYYLGRI